MILLQLPETILKEKPQKVTRTTSSATAGGGLFTLKTLFFMIIALVAFSSTVQAKSDDDGLENEHVKSLMKHHMVRDAIPWVWINTIA